MKKAPHCHLIMDLLPNYIEHMTSEETNEFIESHLDQCEACQEAYLQMSSTFKETVPYPTIEFKFLKKIKRTKVIAAGLSVLLAFVFSYMVYSSNYSISLDKAQLSSAITKFIEPIDSNLFDFSPYVLETKEMNGTLLVSFKDEEESPRNGIAVFKKGINGKYGIHEVHTALSPYTSVVQLFRITMDDERFIAVSGYNLSSEIREYSIDYHTYTTKEALSDYRKREQVKFPVKNQQFMDVYPVEFLENRLSEISENTMNPHYLSDTSFFNGDGEEITEDYIIEEFVGDSAQNSSGYASDGIMYVAIFLILGFGAIMTRYFLTD